MNLKDKLAALKKEAESIMPNVAEGDAVAMKRAAELADAIEETEDAVKAADEFAAKVKGIGAVGSKQPEGKVAAKSLGEFAAEGVRQRGIKSGDRFGANLGTFSKAAASPMVTPSGVANALADVQERLYEGPRRRLVVADLLGHVAHLIHQVRHRIVQRGQRVVVARQLGQRPLGLPQQLRRAIGALAAVEAGVGLLQTVGELFRILQQLAAAFQLVVLAGL